ncbi:hypothetical protein O1L68_00660 [Streptomyces lydicus]|nr:hypothetical protein [Streptomyces lydicus]
MRRRILRAVIAAVVCAVVLFCVPLAVATLRLYRQDEVRALQQLADRVAVTVPAEVRHPRDPMELPRVGPGRQVGVTTTGRGGWSGGTGGRGPAGPRRPGGTGLVVPGRRTVGGDGAGGPGERVRAAVRASASAEGPWRRARVTWAAMGALAVVAVGVAAAVGIRSSRRLAYPMEALAATAGRLEGGELSARAGCPLPEADAVATALNRAAARIEELLRRERAFSADASHQLRTALTRVRLELESGLAEGGAAKREPSAEPDPRGALRTALASLTAMETTIEDLLARPRRAGAGAAGHRGAARRCRAALARRTGGRGPPPTDHGGVAAAGCRRLGTCRRQVLDVLLANALVHGRAR